MLSVSTATLPREIFPKRCVYLTTALAGHTVCLREQDDGRWLVTFRNLELGRLDVDVVGGFDASAELLA